MHGEGEVVAIAFDDVDNRVGGCTTHFTMLFLLEASSYIKHLADYPLLVRLNPSIPWKTRGNASTSLRLYTRVEPEDLMELAVWMVEEYTEGRPGAAGKRPGVALYRGEAWRHPHFRLLYRQALTGAVAHDRVISILNKAGALYYGGRGLVGAAAALGALAPGDDYTFELLAYRSPEYWHAERRLDWDPADSGQWPSCTFNNVDFAEGKPAFAPGGWDPVLAGFRGYCPLAGLCGVLYPEAPVLCTLFRSNQHTGAHMLPLTPRLTPYSVGVAIARVAGEPRVLPKGHTVVEAEAYGRLVDLVFYRETWPLSHTARALKLGDLVKVLAHVKPHTTGGRPSLAVELIEILHLERRVAQFNPRCPVCGSVMKSMGSRGGFKCPRCGYRSTSIRRYGVESFRGLVGGVYTVKPGRYPHLSPPRYRWSSRRLELPLRLDLSEVVSVNSPVTIPSVSYESHHDV